jgi:hypothetical protein
MEALPRSHSALKVARRARTASQYAQHLMMTQAGVHYRLPARNVKASQQVKAVAVRLNGASLKEERS